jgi:vitamin K-dependent gamma-carboxylase
VTDARPAPRLTDRLVAAAVRPVDVAGLAGFRIVFGLVMFVGLLRFLASGWIEPMYGEPRFFFTYPGFGWVEPWPVWGMYVHYAVLAALALAITLGVFYRAAIVGFAIGFAWTQLIDVTNYLNHHYVVVLLSGLLAVLPANAAWSIDVRRRPAIARTTVPAWTGWILRFQVGVVYVFAGLAKAKPDWLIHAQPLDLWLAARTDTPLIGRWLDEPAVAYAMSWAGFLFDTTIVAWLSWSRTRPYAYAVLIGFHAATGYLFNIGMFPLIMTAGALVFFSPSWPRRLLRAMGLARLAGSPPEPAPALAPRQPRRLFVTLAIAYVVLQLALPLRHLVYPGDVLWNEDGMRFAWHVLVREKHGSVTFIARFPDGKQLQIPPHDYLTWRQEKEMAGQPDLILQLARRIGADLRAAGHRGVVIHADTRVSLNGRAPVPMIDPAVDLLQVTDLGPRDWVLPAPTDEPPRLRPFE